MERGGARFAVLESVPDTKSGATVAAAAADDRLAPREVPLLTADLPGTSGSVRLSAEDFRVEELPLYEASGEGAHLYLLVEKAGRTTPRSEEHTSELQSRQYLVCRLLLETKK